ncbi:hypothetical protein FACS189425_03630 [Clostridia bacterium]|nr:hypothetical protein FACS1894202_03690 [Clostridia bacterium]GHV17418.1 hypothetical protein FACS189425_03630 [Clostridia bacterium]
MKHPTYYRRIHHHNLLYRLLGKLSPGAFALAARYKPTAPHYNATDCTCYSFGAFRKIAE